MDQQKCHRTSQDILFSTTILFLVISCFSSVCCDIFCPPAVENVGYNLTAEIYDLKTRELKNSTATLYSGKTVLGFCNLTNKTCEGPDGIPKDTYVAEILAFDDDDLQAVIFIRSFNAFLQNNIFIVWNIDGDLPVQQSCAIAIGSPKNECIHDPCVNARYCTDLLVGYKCECIEGYSGMNCSEGDLRLYCSPPDYFIEFYYEGYYCHADGTDCYIAGAVNQTDIGLNYSLISNNGSSELTVIPLITGDSFWFTICKNFSTSNWIYMIVYELQSNVSVSSFYFNITAELNVYSATTVADVTTKVTDVTDDTTSAFTCPTDKAEFGLFFPETPVNSSIAVNCPEKYAGHVNRHCNLNRTWGSFNYNNCTRKDLKSVDDLVTDLKKNASHFSPEKAAGLLKNVSADLKNSLTNSSTILSGDIIQTVKILSIVGDITKLYETLKFDEETLMDFVSAIDSIIGADVKMWEDTQEDEKDDEEGAVLLVATDNIILASLRDEQFMNKAPLVKENLAIKRGSSSEGDIVFPESQEPGYYNYSGWVLQSNNTAFLSKNAFENTQDSVKYSVILYRNVTDKLKINQTLQKGSLSAKVLNSEILSFSLNTNVTTLSAPLILSFSVQQTNYSDPSCGYLDTSASEAGVWATRGCTTNVTGNRVQCSCNHLTNFAVLMSPYGKTSTKDKAILSIISAVGCGISIFCLVITIIVYLVLWKFVKSDRSILHINLSACLILAYIIFLAGVNRPGNKVACKVVAALLHYFFLVVFFIMLSEGIEIFKLVSFVLSSKSIICGLISFSYGVPVIIVAISLGVTKTQGYGSDTFCWLSTKDGLIWAFVGPVLLVILINFIIIIRVLKIMQNTKNMTEKSMMDRTKSAVRTIFVLSPLLGVTWVFGVLSVNKDTVVFQYLFAIFNSLQGLFIFICFCLLTPQVREGFNELKRKHHANSYSSSQKTVSSTFSGRSLFPRYKVQKKNTQSSSGYNSTSNTGTTSTKSTSPNSISENEQYHDHHERQGNNDNKDTGNKINSHQEYGQEIPITFINPGIRNTIPMFEEINQC